MELLQIKGPSHFFGQRRLCVQCNDDLQTDVHGTNTDVTSLPRRQIDTSRLHSNGRLYLLLSDVYRKRLLRVKGRRLDPEG